MDFPVIDADGHVMEDDSMLDFIQHRSITVRRVGDLYPGLDFLHNDGHLHRAPDAFGGGKPVGPDEWVDFLEFSGMEAAVLYPTRGLQFANIQHPDWASLVAHAYNSWLHDRYLKRSPKFKGMALVPLQDVSEAVIELRRAVTELGMVGAMINSRGYPMDLGHPMYWPLYAEAEKLGCVIGVHGGAHHSLGIDTLGHFVPIHGLGHSFGLIIALSGMVYHGVFRQFPKLKVGFMEGGAGWVTFWMDRMERSHAYFADADYLGRYKGPTPDEDPSDYLSSGNVWVGCEGSEKGLGYQVQRAGAQHFLFASDFPHEIGKDQIKHEIEEIEERDDLTESAKSAILAGNARTFYNF